MSKSNEAQVIVPEVAPVILEDAPKAPEATETPAPATPTAKISKIERDGLVLSALYTEFKTVSAVIRTLWSKGYTRSEISDFTGKRYQHVRNVLVQDAQKAEAAARQAK